jgi:hypothetical protein
MILKHQVNRWFFDYVERQEIPRELKDSMRTHERVAFFIKNLYEQLLKAETTRMFAKKPKLSEKTLRDTVESMAEVFISSVRMEERKRHESKCEALRKQKLISDAKDLQSTAEGKPAGEFEELGLKFPEDRILNAPKKS